MSLRVIAGQFGGRKLESVPGYGTRPLLGQVREALFNILGEDVEGALVWDLFAGTGASGIEALSRGARRVVFVEKGIRAIRVLHTNLGLIDPDRELDYEVVRANAWAPPRPCGGMAPAGSGMADAETEVDEDREDDREDDETLDDVRDDDGDGDDDDDGHEAATSSRSDGLQPEEEAPQLIFLDPPYLDVREDPTLAVARAAALYDRLAPGGKLLFHFPDGVLDEDDFERFAHVDLRVWGQAAVAILTR